MYMYVDMRKKYSKFSNGFFSSSKSVAPDEDTIIKRNEKNQM